MPISPEPPSAQNSSSSPGSSGTRSHHIVQQAQPLNGEVGLNRVECLRMLVEQGREAAGSDHRHGTHDLALEALGQASIIAT